MVKYDLVTETLLTDLLHVLYESLTLAIRLPTAASDGVSFLLLLTKVGILVFLYFIL